jgi:hypothetical protein
MRYEGSARLLIIKWFVGDFSAKQQKKQALLVIFCLESDLTGGMFDLYN